MVVTRNRLLISLSAVLLLLAACKNPYYDRVKEVVDAAKAPRMALTAASVSLSSGGTYGFGPVAVGASRSAVFTISNAGKTDLALSGGAGGVSIGGTNPDQFNLLVLPALTVISPGKSAPFTLAFAPTVGGALSATVTIGSNDPAAGSYTFTVTGSGAAAAPIFTPAAGTYSADQDVVLSSATSGAVIYYTVDGSTPTTASSVFSLTAPIPVHGNGTNVLIKAFAAKAGLANSAVVTGTFTINSSAVSTPNFTPPGGPYSSDQLVTISCATPGATIYYTTDGTTPSTGSPVFGPVIPVVGNNTVLTIKALAKLAGFTDATASAIYNVVYPLALPPAPTPPPNIYNLPLTVTLSAAGLPIAYTTDGSTPTTDGHGVITHGTPYTPPIVVPVSMTIRAIAYGPGWTDSPVITFPYTLQPLIPVLGPAGGTYPTPTVVTITCSTPSVGIRYTTDGTTPSSTNGTPIASGGTVLISATSTLRAVAYLAGWTDSPIASGNFTISINQPPTFNSPGGRLGNADTIGLTITTPGSHIAYTLDGSVPVTDGLGTITHGTAYGAPFTPPYGTFVVKAIAYQTGWGDSAVVSQSYHKDLFLYSMDVFGGGVDVFSFDPATGALSHTSTFGLPVPPGGMASDSNGTIMFVGGSGTNQVWGFTIDPLTGALTTTGMPGAASNPGAVCIRGDNKALYAADPVGGTIHAWAVGGGGALFDLGTVTAGSAPVSVVSDINSLFLYAATSASGGSIYGYNLSPAGTPTVMAGAPFPAAGSPTFVTIDPAGAHLYESDHSTGIVRFWNIDSMSGNLTPAFGTPYSVTSSPEKMAIDPAGKYLYVTDSVANQVVMARIAADGTLTTGGWAYLTGGSAPKGVFVDPSGKFVVVANSGTNNFSVFSLDPATGFLTLTGTYPSALPDPEEILITGTH